MIRYVIIDDEYIAHDIIKGYCDLLPNMTLLKSCYDALEAFEYLNEADLIFLDLNMPRLKGFDFLKTLLNPPRVIVTSAYSEYALEGYEYNISDYLLKPFGFDRFLKAMNKTFGAPPVKGLPEHPQAKSRIFLQTQKKYIQVEFETVLYLESVGNYTKIVTLEEVITLREKVSVLLEMFPSNDFIQVHKSFAVALRHIKSIDGNRIFLGSQTIPIGKMYRNNILRWLN